MTGELLAALLIAGVAAFWGASLGMWRALYAAPFAWGLAFVTLLPANDPMGLAALCAIGLVVSAAGCGVGVLARRIVVRRASAHRAPGG